VIPTKLVAICAAIALALGLAVVGTQYVQLQSLKTELAQQTLECAERETSWQSQAAAASESYRALEARLQLSTQELSDARTAAQADSAARLAAWAAERSRLRDSLQAFASGRGLTAEAAAATCSQRAAALGNSLGEALREEESLVSQLEDQRADTRSLLGYATTVQGVAP
jgi:hypothetical protein